MKIVQFETLDAVAPRRWDELLTNSSDSSVFQTQAWLQAWCDSIAAVTGKLKIFAVVVGDRVAGIAPLASMPTDRSGAATESWCIVGDDYSDYQIFPVWDGSFEVLDALFAAMKGGLARDAVVVFRDVPQFSALGRYLATRAAGHRGGRVIAGTYTACPSLRIKGNEAFVARVLRKASLKRHERAIKSLGEVIVEHFHSGPEVEALLPQFFYQHIARWRNRARPSLFENPVNQAFYRAVTARLGSVGALLFTTVRVNNHIVAQHFGLRSNHDLLWYKPAFDPTYARYGPGEVLLRHLIDYAYTHSLRTLDFTRGDEAFKRRFASCLAFNRQFTWYSDRVAHLRSRAAGGATRMLRRWLPHVRAKS